MAKAVSGSTKITSINVRMYRAGTGDFFILQFKKGKTVSFNLMIDCGCIQGTREKFDILVDDLNTHTGGTIDLLVVTHEHADHINGFEKSKDIFDTMRFKKVWFAWTEDKDDPIANDYRAQFSELDRALTKAVSKLNNLLETDYYATLFADEAEGDLLLEGKKYFIESLTHLNAINMPTHLAATGTVKPTMVELLKDYKVIKPNTKVEFLEPGDVINGLTGATGISFYVLGPPRKQVYLNLTEKEGESFQKREQKSTVDFAFVSAFSDTDDSTDRLPFDTEFELGDNQNAVKNTYQNTDDWRKIDNDWLYSAGSLAMRYQRSINNTSLALAIQFEESEKVLLFPGDAEFGNWESWHDGLEWSVKVNGQTSKKKAEYFLNKTVFYKVGHHLSQNGTAKAKGIEMMTSPNLVAMATLDFKKIMSGWLNTMPNDILGAELIRKTEGKLFFVGDRKNILFNIKTSRVSVKKAHEDTLNSLNKPFDEIDGKPYIEYEIKA